MTTHQEVRKTWWNIKNPPFLLLIFRVFQIKFAQMRVKTLEIVEVSQISEHVRNSFFHGLLDSFEVRFWRNSMFKVSYYSLRKTGLGNFQVFFPQVWYKESKAQKSVWPNSKTNNWVPKNKQVRIESYDLIICIFLTWFPSFWLMKKFHNVILLVRKTK